MAHSFAIDETRNLLVVRFQGEIPYSEELRAVGEGLGDPRLKPGVRILVDRRESKTSATSQEVRDHVEQIEPSVEALGSPRAAVVVSHDLDFGITRMFEMQAESQLQHEFKVFRSMTAACAWPGIEESGVPRPDPTPA